MQIEKNALWEKALGDRSRYARSVQHSHCFALPLLRADGYYERLGAPALPPGLILPQDPVSGRAGTMCVTSGQLELPPDKSGSRKASLFVSSGARWIVPNARS